MNKFPLPLDLKKLRVLPLADRKSLSQIEKVLVAPDAPPTPSPEIQSAAGDCIQKIAAARKGSASVILMYGAHLVKNGAHRIVIELMERGLITHLATNGAGSIHDWELAFLGRTEESVKKNVATGTFGTWDETGRCIHLALLAGALRNEGYGRSLGRFICEDGVTLPTKESLEKDLRNEPLHPLTAARAELLSAMVEHQLPSGRIEVKHAWREDSIVAQAFKHQV